MRDVTGAVNHLKKHQKYPATRMDLILACNNLSDFLYEDKKWFADHLPNRIYNSVEDVFKALSL